MYHMRKTKTASGAIAVQVVLYKQRKMIVCSHIGSAHEVDKVTLLEQEALRWIEKATKQISLFPLSGKETQKETILVVSKSRYLGVRYTFLYGVLSRQLRFFSFHAFENQLLFDLVLIRIVQPASKLASLKLLSAMFGITYQRGHLYETLAAMPSLKEQVSEAIIHVAKHHFSFDFSMVFYDVTTLYYESFTEDEDMVDKKGNVIEKGLKKAGWSKDLKFNQPQIVIGLMVNKDGFPVSYEVFEGNTFEGDTFIPSILAFKRKYRVKKLTIVADAAMISLDNVKKLKAHKLKYIVGARMANISPVLIKQISQELHFLDGATGRIRTDKGILVYDFSLKRYQKDRREMDKQIAKAKKLVESDTEGKRTKFLKFKETKGNKKKGEGKKKEKAYELNLKLIEQATLLLGIKGYYTNLPKRQANNKTIIDHYHNLWHVEQAFRIAKSDLATRPIYHFKRKTIEAHILICFMALAVCKYMELRTGKSTKQIVQLLRSVTEARIKNKLTGEVVVFREELSGEVEQLRKTLSKS